MSSATGETAAGCSGRRNVATRGKGPGLWRWLLVMVAAAAQAACAGEPVSEQRSVAGFHAVSVAVASQVSLARGREEGVTLEAAPATLERIVTEVKDGELAIRWRENMGWWQSRGPVRIHVVYRSLDGLTLAGSARVATDSLTGEAFRLVVGGIGEVRIHAMAVRTLDVKVSGSGGVTVEELAADDAEVVVSGSGGVTLAGQVGNQTVRVSGSGEVDNGELASREALARVSGSGSIRVRAQARLEAEVSGSGEVVYLGEPEVQSRVSGSGQVRAG